MQCNLLLQDNTREILNIYPAIPFFYYLNQINKLITI
jgi:hypothetical protein